MPPYSPEELSTQVSAYAVYEWCRRNYAALSWGIVGIAIVLTLVLGVFGFTDVNGHKLPLSTRLYLSLQLFTVESGALSDMPRVSWALEIARWSGVVAAFGTVVNTLLAVFGRQVHAYSLRRMSHHAVIIGAGQSGAKLATDLLSYGYRVAVIDVSEANPAISALMRRGAYELIADGCEADTLEAASVHSADVLIIVAGSDTRNIEIASVAERVCERRSPLAEPLRCYVHISDEQLGTLLDRSRGKVVTSETAPGKRFESSTFNRFTNSARALLSSHPLDRDGISIGDDCQVHLVISGLNPLGEALLMQSLAIGHFANNVPLAVTIIDESASRKHQRLTSRMPELEKCAKLTFVDGGLDQEKIRQRVNALVNDSEQVVIIAICDDDPRAALTSCLDLLPSLVDTDCTLFVNSGAVEHGGTALGLVQSGSIRLVSFGDADSACSAGVVVRRDLDVLARRIHEAYLHKRNNDGDSTLHSPAMKPWDHLDGELQDMNRQQADHIPVKLRAIRHRVVRAVVGVDAPEFQLSETAMEALAETEHNRWCASRRLSGWRYGTSRCDKQKVHPDLVPWNELSEATREYDRDTVRNLPKLLAEIGYAISKSE